MVKITLLDGEEITLESGTVLNGYKNSSNDPTKEFYLEAVYSNSIDGIEGKEASRLATVNAKVGIMGFILSVDCFSIGRDFTNSVMYRSSAVKSVENIDYHF